MQRLDEELDVAEWLEGLGCRVSWKGAHVWRVGAACKLGDHDLPHLQAFSQLRDLDLQDSQVTDAGLVNLGGLRMLGRIHLGHTDVTAAGLRHLAGCGNLTDLDLTGTRVLIEDAVSHVKAMPKLRWLDLRLIQRTESTAAAIAELKRCLPELQFHPLGAGGIV